MEDPIRGDERSRCEAWCQIRRGVLVRQFSNLVGFENRATDGARTMSEVMGESH